MPPPDPNRITRRRFAADAGAAAAAVAMMATMTQQAPGANQPTTTTQPSSGPTTSPTTAPTAEDISRVAQIERSLGRALSPQMREAVAQQVHQNDQAWSRGRQYPVPDGTEPAFVFTPDAHVASMNPNPTTREADDER